MHRRKSSFTAFTLVEVLLTLAVIAVVAGLVVPSIDARLQDAEFGSAVTQVRQSLDRTRLRAMDEGRTWGFVILADKRSCCAYPTSSPDQRHHWNLAMPIQFAATTADAVGTSLDAKNAALLHAPIYFYSDGTSTDASFMIVNDTGQSTLLHIRRLSGVHVE